MDNNLYKQIRKNVDAKIIKLISSATQNKVHIKSPIHPRKKITKIGVDSFMLMDIVIWLEDIYGVRIEDKEIPNYITIDAITKVIIERSNRINT